MREIPPISIFSMISSCDFESFTESSKGYKSTTTKSIEGILKLLSSLISLSKFLRCKIPPNIFGCRVFTLPPKIDG